MNHPDHTAEPRTGLDAVIEAYKKDVDVTLIRENLRLTVDQRFQQLMKLQQFAEELQHAGRECGHKSDGFHRSHTPARNN